MKLKVYFQNMSRIIKSKYNINKCIDAISGANGYWKECDMDENTTKNVT